MRYLALIAVVLLCAVSLESQISPGALHRLIGNPISNPNISPPTLNLNRWWHAGDLNGSVSSWQDRINGITFASSTNQPTATNGYVVFSGTQSLYLPGFFKARYDSDSIVIFVWSRLLASGDQCLLGDPSGGSYNGLLPRASSIYLYNGNWNNYITSTRTNYEIFDMVYDHDYQSSVAHWYTNGVSASGNISYSGFGTNALFLGYLPMGPWHANNVRIYDIFVYSNRTDVASVISNVHNWSTNTYHFSP